MKLSDVQIDVSVIVPVFNCANYIEIMIRSLTAQDGVKLEIIAIDDGSSDDSLAILERLAAEDLRLKVSRQPNAGASCTRNAGIALARGRWVAFADGDDWLAPGALKTWFDLGELQSLDLVLGNGFRFDADPERQARVEINPWRPAKQVMSGEEWVVDSVAQRAWKHYTWLQFIRRDVLVAGGLRFIDRIIHQDILWSADLAFRVQRVGMCPTPYYGYRVNPGSVTESPSRAALLRRARSYLKVLCGLVDRADAPECSPRLRRALLRQTNIESGHWLGLVRKKIDHPARRAVLARTYRRSRLARHAFAGATSQSEYWRAVRGWWMTLR